MYLSRLKTTTP